MLRSGNFWVGVGVGVLGIYGYHMWQSKKMQKG
jgi:hypothetical protein